MLPPPLVHPNLFPDPVTGHFIRLEFFKFELYEDFDMTVHVRRVYVDSKGNSLLEMAQNRTDLTPDQKNRLLALYQTTIKTATTRGFKVDPSTGTQVQIDENGNWPEGSVDEKLIWLSVTPEQTKGKTNFENVLRMIGEAMGNLLTRGRI